MTLDDEDAKPAERTAALAIGLMHAAALYARRQLIAVDTIAEEVRPDDDGATVSFTATLAFDPNAYLRQCPSCGGRYRP